MTDREAPQVKPEPFLTIIVTQGDAGTHAECPEMGMSIGMGPFKRDEAIKGIHSIVRNGAETIMRRDDIIGEKKDLAKKILEELGKGSEIGDLFSQAPENISFEADISPDFETGGNFTRQ